MMSDLMEEEEFKSIGGREFQSLGRRLDLVCLSLKVMENLVEESDNEINELMSKMTDGFLRLLKKNIKSASS